MNEDSRKVTLITIREAAKRGILPENTLRRLCKNDLVPCLHIGSRTLINPDLLVAFLNSSDMYKKREKD